MLTDVWVKLEVNVNGLSALSGVFRNFWSHQNPEVRQRLLALPALAGSLCFKSEILGIPRVSGLWP